MRKGETKHEELKFIIYKIFRRNTGMKKGLIILTLISLLSIGVFAQGEESYFYGGIQENIMKKSLEKNLNLTQDQKNKLKTLREETKDKIKALSSEDQTREEFIQSLQSIRDNQKSELNDILTPAQQKMVESKEATVQKGRDDFEKKLNLTDEQKSKINSIRDEYYQKMRALNTEDLTEAQHKKEIAKLIKEEIQARNQVLTAQQKTFLRSERNKMK